MLFGFTLPPGKIIEWVLWDHISEHKEYNMETGSSQHGFTNSKPWLTDVIALCDDTRDWSLQGYWNGILHQTGTARAKSQGTDIFILSVCFMHQDEILFCIYALFSLWFHYTVMTSAFHSLHLLPCFWHTWLNLKRYVSVSANSEPKWNSFTK